MSSVHGGPPIIGSSMLIVGITKLGLLDKDAFMEKASKTTDPYEEIAVNIPEEDAQFLQKKNLTIN